MAKQVDSDQTPVDDADDPLESETHTEVKLTGSTKVSLDQTQAMDVDKEEEEQSVVDQGIDMDDDEVE
ncbi:7510_t:CDS:1, partial [Funneliformis geosporum]